MKKYTLLAGVIALAVVVVLWVVNVRVAKAPGPQACTQEAKLCPNGSAVGRTGPNCEFAACPTTATTTSTSNNSGVRGTVSLGPTCPVERIPPDPQCADRPYETTVSVYLSGINALVMTGKSDASGIFTFPLPAGSYILKASGGSMLPRCNPVTVSVSANKYVTATISCDTGIR